LGDVRLKRRPFAEAPAYEIDVEGCSIETSRIRQAEAIDEVEAGAPGGSFEREVVVRREYLAARQTRRSARDFA
jgi:hypothetical protein